MWSMNRGGVRELAASRLEMIIIITMRKKMAARGKDYNYNNLDARLFQLLVTCLDMRSTASGLRLRQLPYFFFAFPLHPASTSRLVFKKNDTYGNILLPLVPTYHRNLAAKSSPLGYQISNNKICQEIIATLRLPLVVRTCPNQ